MIVITTEAITIPAIVCMVMVGMVAIAAVLYPKNIRFDRVTTLITML